jgi:hypothetical protein
MHQSHHHRRSGRLHRRAALLTVAACTVVVLPLTAVGGTDAGADRVLSQSSPATLTTDPSAIWAILRKLPADDVDVLHPNLPPEVRDDLAAVVHASADAASADG